MKAKTVAVLTFALLVGLAAQAWAGLSVSQEKLELGNLKEGVKAERVVTLTNSGQEAVKISNVTTSCSCTSTALGKPELQAGESTELKIVYNTWKFPGKFEKYITVFTGPQGKQKTVITLVGYVDPVPMGVVEVKPRKLSVGTLPVGQATEKDLVIKNTGDADLSISKVVSKKFDTMYFDAQKSGGDLVVPAGQEVVVKLQLQPQEAGRYLDYVLIFGEARNITEAGYKVVVLGSAN